MKPIGGAEALEARRLRRVRTSSLDAIVVDVDATENEAALAVLQAPLHPRERGERIVYGYDLDTAGLGGWIGDRRLRLTVWPAVIDADGRIVEDRHDEPGADLLVLDIDPVEHRGTLVELRELGRLVIAGPEGGPVPLVLEVDRDLLASVLERLDG